MVSRRTPSGWSFTTFGSSGRRRRRCRPARRRRRSSNHRSQVPRRDERRRARTAAVADVTGSCTAAADTSDANAATAHPARTRRVDRLLMARSSHRPPASPGPKGTIAGRPPRQMMRHPPPPAVGAQTHPPSPAPRSPRGAAWAVGETRRDRRRMQRGPLSSRREESRASRNPSGAFGRSLSTPTKGTSDEAHHLAVRRHVRRRPAPRRLRLGRRLRVTTTTRAPPPPRHRDEAGAAPAVSGDGSTVAVAEVGDLRPVLVDAEASPSTCSPRTTAPPARCSGPLDTWPAAVADGTPEAGDGVDATLTLGGRRRRPDQLVYNGHLLYRFSGDAAPRRRQRQPSPRGTRGRRTGRAGPGGLRPGRRRRGRRHGPRVAPMGRVRRGPAGRLRHR